MALEFGVRLPGLHNVQSFAKRAEALGFDYLVCPEHLLFHHPVPNAFIALAVAAGATNRIKLLSAATLLPLYPPLLAAKMTSVLDVASGGRFNLGVGIGGEFPLEFAASGIPVAERALRTDETLEVLQSVFVSPTASYRGRFTSFDDVDMQPRPIQKPWPPIWIGGRKLPAMKRAAKYGDVWMPYLYTPEALANSIRTILSYRASIGRLGELRSSVHVFAMVHRDPMKAQKIATETVSEIYMKDFGRLASRYLVTGTPSMCVRRLREYADAGATSIHLALACPAESAHSVVRLLAEEVVPQLREAHEAD